MTILALAAAAAVSLAGTGAADCPTDERLALVCGVPVPEDLVAIPGTRWLVATSMPRDGSAGGLYLIDIRSRAARKLDLAAPESRRRPRFASGRDEAREVGKCAPLDPTRFISHGIALTKGRNGVHRLYVVGHGGREAIELFNIDARRSVPVVRWAGCVGMPDGVEANSVVGLPGGGLMFTTLYDPGDRKWPSRIAKLAAGTPSGAVFEWHAATGFSRLAIPPVSGPNGLAVTADGKSVFLAGWGDRIVRRIDRNGRETANPVALDFLPDNIHWSPEGALLAAGQPTTVQSLFSCSAGKRPETYCVNRWSVAQIDPVEMKVTATNSGDTAGQFGDSTAAVLAGGQMWLGSISGNRIAAVPAPVETE